jgi:ribonuclease P protein component
VLPTAHRLRRSSEFSAVVSGGSRARSGPLVVHHRGDLGCPAPRIGFVVSRAVGGSVVRHRVARRLRAQAAARIWVLPAGSGTVVRALPPAATATSAELGTALDRAFARVTGSADAAGTGFAR